MYYCLQLGCRKILSKFYDYKYIFVSVCDCLYLYIYSNIYERKNSNEVIVLWKICLNFIDSE